MKKVLVGAVVVIAVIAIAGALSSSGGGSSSDSGISTGLGSKDASADVQLGSCKKPSFGVMTCQLIITNHSDGPSDYYIEAVAKDPSGANVGDGNGTASHVDPGGTAKADLTLILSQGAGKDVTVQLTTVQRTASA